MSARAWAVSDRIARGWVGRPWPRRALAGGAAAALMLAALVPPVCRASATLAPPVAGSGLTPVFGQFGGNAALMSSQPVEIDLAVAEGYDVAAQAAARLGRIGPRSDAASRARVMAGLADAVTVEALRGGMLRIAADGGSEAEALALVVAWQDALQNRLAAIGRAHGPAAGPLVLLVSPHVEPGPHPRPRLLAAAVFVLLLGLAAEAYAAGPPRRGLFPR